MRKNTQQTGFSRSILTRCATAVLVLVIMLQAMLVGVAAAVSEIAYLRDGSYGNQSSASQGGVTNFDSEALTEALIGDVIKYMKKDLLQRIEDYNLTGSAEVILMFSDKSLVGEYTEKYADKMTYAEFKVSDEAAAFELELQKGRDAALRELEDKGLVFDVKHTYSHVLDGAFVKTTYENMEEICAHTSVSGAMLSQTYLPMKAPNNPVDVYDTGIFNSGSVSAQGITGKGTIVAVLDTGCDYAHAAFTTYTVVNPKYSRDDIAALLPFLESSKTSEGLEAREVYYGNLTGGKIAYGYDYADKDADIMPFENSHGTHVAGIIAGYDAKDGNITGVAIDAQLAIMKVFSDYDTGAKDGDIIAALEDCITLGVDAINMSLGTSCGFSEESAADELYKNTLYSNIEKAGISLVVAASNDHSSGYGGENGNTNKTDNPDSATVGSPSTYPSSFTVASVSGKKENFMIANGKDEIFFIQSYSTAAKEYNFFEMMNIKEGEKKVYEYVAVPGFGDRVNYSGIDVKGKVALVSRGDITFEEKVQFAQEAGAIAVLIYNNVYGDITMTIGNFAKIPAVSIGKDEGEMLAALKTGTIEFDLSNQAGPFMSDFSSWGPTPDLKLKPEITAHGGSIVSAVVGGEYDEMSGTSMAAPNMCGITVLIRQYVNDKFPGISATAARDLVNRLCMSTATIAKDKKDHPYSPRKQGAGIADITKATTTPAYLLVDGIGKTKLELGDDPARTGVYEMSIKLVNISTSAQSYKLGNLTMTESVSVSDPEYVAELAYMLSNTTEYSVQDGTLSADNVVTVAAGATATINVKITLSDADKAYIDSTFENGMYVEGFLTFDNTAENGVDLNAPFLAFYGNWGDAPIFDLDYYEVETEAHDKSIDEDDKIKADYYATTPLGTYYYDYIIPLGTYLYEMDEKAYSAIPATMEHAAISCVKTSISGIYGVFAGLLRGAKELNISITNTDTGEVVWSMTEYNCAKSHYYGAPRGYMSKFDLPMYDEENNKLFAANNTHFEVTMSAKLDWDGGENKSDTYSFSFYVDYEAPTVVGSEYRVKYDKSRKENRYYLDVMIYDNHYAMSCRPILIYDFTNDFTGDYNEDNDVTKTFSSLTEYPIPIYQQNKGEATKVTIEITDYMDIIKNSKTPNGITLYVDDYAMNAGVYYIPFPETDSELAFDIPENELVIDKYETADLVEYLIHKDGSVIDNDDYLYTLKWSSSDESVVAIKDGKIEGLNQGEATITVTSDTWLEYEYEDKDNDGAPDKDKDGRLMYTTTEQSITLTVKVTDVVNKDDENSGQRVPVDELLFISYDTKKAYNSHIDYSEIGRAESINYFDGNYNVKFYPGEQIKLNYELKPWNLDPSRYTVTWTSSNTKVATVDNNGVVTAVKEGTSRITLKVVVDEREELFARLSVEVKSEFVIENRELIAYKGTDEHVVIPDDEGILYIGAYAFSHFLLDNKKPVIKDEHGYYELDDKKVPAGANQHVKSVVIPEGVESVKKYAFYGCKGLTEVVLPDSCETIGTSAFEGCTNLTTVNFAGDPNVENDKDGVKIVSDRAFYNCQKLNSSGVDGVDMSGIYAIGEYAFYNTAFTVLDLPRLSRISTGAFYQCNDLVTLKLGERTRISDSMFRGCTKLKDVTIYSDTIGDNAFYGCTQLSSVTLENNVTYLGSNAFYGCSNLAKVTVNADIEYIGNSAFKGCSKNLSFEIPTDSTLTNYVIDDVAIYSKDGETLVLVLPSAVTTFTVPKSVKYISGGAFTMLSSLKTVTFAPGSAIESIGDAAFAGLTNLETVTLPTGRDVKIGIRAFEGTTKLKTIDLSCVSEIGDYAFYMSGIAAVEIGTSVSGVNIGSYAFASTKSLKSVKLGNNAKIENNAFEKSAVETVDLVGDATIGKYAFAQCTKLTSFDFADITEVKDANGKIVEYKIGDYAFYKCTSLAQVVAPKILAIGNGTFAGCTSLAKLSAAMLESVGNGAFYEIEYVNDPYSSKNGEMDLDKNLENIAFDKVMENAYNDEELANAQIIDVINSAIEKNIIAPSKIGGLKEIIAPNLEKIGDYAFTLNVNLKTVELPSLKSMGKLAFAGCMNLYSVTVSDELTVLPERAFYGCLVINPVTVSFLENLERIGTHAFYGTLPFITQVAAVNLYLPNLVRLDDQALFGMVGIATLDAENLTYIGNEAFNVCMSLEEVKAPKLEYLGDAAFAQTALVDFEITNNLKYVGTNPFFMCENFVGCYVSESDYNNYTAALDNVMIENGALYLKNYRGYTLISYPAASTDMQFVVANGTTRIELYAAAMNKDLIALDLPSTLRTIADFAFFGCDSLSTVTFRSYNAPTLESMMSISKVDSDAGMEYVTVHNLDKFHASDILYKYNYSLIIDGYASRGLYQNNFKAGIGGINAPKMTAVLPDNAKGYDAITYQAYFNVSDETWGVTAGKYATDFIEAVNKLPESVDRFDKLVVEAAITAFNALEVHKDEKVFVDASVIAKFERIRTQYNVNVVEGKLASLFGMYNTEYHFNLLKEATAAYNALTDYEREFIANPEILAEKKAELSAAMGVEVNFANSYADHFVKEEIADNEEDEGNSAGLIIIIIAAAVIAAGGAAAAVIVILKKKKTNAETEETVKTENSSADADEANVTKTEEVASNTVSDGEENTASENSDAKED